MWSKITILQGLKKLRFRLEPKSNNYNQKKNTKLETSAPQS